MIDDLKAALRDVAQVFHFEHWLRFYYARDKDGKVVIEMPAEDAAQTKSKYPELAGLIDTLNNTEIDYESSVRLVGEFVHKTLDGVKYGQNVVPQVLDGKDFKIDLHLFSLWVRGHEAMLDERIMDFGEWTTLYGAWKNTEQVARYALSLRQADKFDTDPGASVH